MKKKILFIIPSLATGGANSSLNSLYSQLKERYDIQIFAISHLPCNHNFSFDEALLPEDTLLSLIYTNYADQRGWHKVLATVIKAIRSLFRIFNKDLGLIRGKRVVERLERTEKNNFVVGFQEGNATKIAAFFTKASKIAWIHCDYNKFLPQDQSEETMYSSFNKVVCVSEYTSSVFTQKYPALANRTITIYNLIDKEKIFQMANWPIDDKRFKTSELMILSVGRFANVKRFREIPAVASVLKDHGLSFVWYVLGPDDGSGEGSSFSANMKKYDVQDCVKWLGGKLNPFPYFKTANLYVCLSESEACPMVFKEAQLFGLPIITTDFPSSYEFVHDGEGIITSFEKLSEAIEVMAAHIKNGYKLPNKSDDSQKTLDKINKLFN